MFICPLYWAYHEYPDVQTMVLVHEASHYYGTWDYGYGQAAVKELARGEPSKAIYNADSYAHFADNLAKLDAAAELTLRNITFYCICHPKWRYSSSLDSGRAGIKLLDPVIRRVWSCVAHQRLDLDTRGDAHKEEGLSLYFSARVWKHCVCDNLLKSGFPGLFVDTGGANLTGLAGVHGPRRMGTGWVLWDFQQGLGLDTPIPKSAEGAGTSLFLSDWIPSRSSITGIDSSSGLDPPAGFVIERIHASASRNPRRHLFTVSSGRQVVLTLPTSGGYKSGLATSPSSVTTVLTSHLT